MNEHAQREEVLRYSCELVPLRHCRRKPLTTQQGYQRKDFEGVIAALADGSLKPDAMITSKIRMDRLVQEGYTPLIKEKDKHVCIDNLLRCYECQAATRCKLKDVLIFDTGQDSGRCQGGDLRTLMSKATS